MNGARTPRAKAPNPIAADRRRARKRKRLPENAACLFCGISNPEVLVRVSKSLLEADHTSGEANDPDLVGPLCLNDHALRTAHQHDAGVDLLHVDGRSVLARQAAALENEAAFLRDFADAKAKRAEELRALEGALDRVFPGWRELEEAKP